MWLPAFVCPECRARVSTRGQGFECRTCKLRFDHDEGIYRFLTSARAAARQPFIEQYRRVRREEGRTARTAAYYRALPLTDAEDPHADEWRIRGESYRTLLSPRTGVLSNPDRPLRVLDLGAGSGWFSNRMASLGHEAVAVDLLDDDDEGLPISRMYDHAFVAVRADFDALPFAAGQFDVVVLNASLHYASDPAQTLREADHMLSEGGALVVMDSPTFKTTADGEAMVQAQLERIREQSGDAAPPIRPGVGFLTFERLGAIAGRLGRRSAFYPSRGPLAWRARRTWSRRRLKRDPAAFGVWVAR